MSDYGDDDISDYEEWMYVEDEYMVADDLAEHVVNSPPPAFYLDEDDIPEWDRYDYYNDIEYDSDGYDDDKDEDSKTGEKRKRGGENQSRKKKQKLGSSGQFVDEESPVIWRSRASREVKPNVLNGELEPYALLKDWRVRLAETPAWAAGSPRRHSLRQANMPQAEISEAAASEAASPTVEDGDCEEGGTVLGQEALMASLQSHLASADGPLKDMDPQQMLQFLMRMVEGEDAADDIAGELADSMLAQGDRDEEDEDEEAPANLLAWLSKQRDAPQDGHLDAEEPATSKPESPKVRYKSDRPPTPPSSETNRNVRGMEPGKPETQSTNAFDHNCTSLESGEGAFSRKRKSEDETVDTAPKRRATRSFAAPTAANQANTAPASRPSKSGRMNGS